MVSIGLTSLAVSAVLFFALLFGVQAEQKRGSRFLLGGVRGWFDKGIGSVERKIGRSWDHFMKYVVQLGWYYGLHSFLRAILRTLVACYESVENVFERNRHRTKQLRAEKQKVTNGDTHLAEMAQHKVDTALTPAQQRKLKESHLKGD